MVKYGWNWDTGSINFERAIPALQKSNGDCHLVMISNGGFFLKQGDIDTIRKILSALPSHVKIIVRLFSRLEGDWQRYPPVGEYEANWRWVKAQLGALIHRVIFDYKTNEPNLGGADILAARRFVTDCIEHVEAAARAGIVLAVGCFSVGTPHESLLDTEYMRLWQAIAKHGQAISIHLYSTPVPEIGETVGLSTVLDPVKARAALVDKRWTIEMQGWFIGRAMRIIKIWQVAGLGIPSIYVTEALIDNVFNTESSHIKESWRSKAWAIDDYNRDPRGAACWANWLAEVFKQEGFNFEQSLAYIFRHARKNIFWHSAFKGVCIFALNAQWGLAYGQHPKGTNYGAGSNFDYPAFDRFRNDYLPAINAEVYEPMTTPTNPAPPTTTNPVIAFPALDSPLWQSGTIITGQDGANMRSQPYIDKTNIRGVLLATHSYAVSRYNEAETVAGRVWWAFRLVHDGSIKNVWIAESVIANWKLDTIPVPPPVEPKPEVYAVVIYGWETRGSLAEIEDRKKMLSGIFQTIISQFETPAKVE